MKTRSLIGLLPLLTLTAFVSPAQAQGKHPTVTAVHNYGHRKTAHAKHAVRATGHHVRAWGHRKRHNFRSWLNNH